LRPGRSEVGDSLIAVLIAMVVLGVAGVAMLLAFYTSVFGTAAHRSLASMDTVLRSAAEEATSAMQQSAGTANSAFTCPSSFIMNFPVLERRGADARLRHHVHRQRHPAHLDHRHRRRHK
jgi:hypothetical protein